MKTLGKALCASTVMGTLLALAGCSSVEGSEGTVQKAIVYSLPHGELSPQAELAYIEQRSLRGIFDAYIAVRREDNCPTREFLREFLVPYRNDESISWDEVHARRARLLEELRNDKKYKC